MSKYFLKVFSIYFVISIVTGFLLYFSLLNIWQERIFDKFFIKKDVPGNVVIFAVDNESISSIGQWPWSRKVFADAVNKLQKAKAIGIDVNFSEASSTDPAGDWALSQAISNSKPNVVLPVLINTATKEMVKPLPVFEKGSLLGQVNMLNDDGIVRIVKNSLDGVTGFGALLARQNNTDLVLPDAMRINYAGPEKTFLTLPIGDLLQNKIPERIYENNIVLIGATAPDLHDANQTPFGSLPGVEIHANIINTLLGQTFYYTLPIFFSFLIILICNLLALVLIVKIKRLGTLIISLVIFWVLLNLFAIALFSFNIILPVLYMNIGFIATAGALIIFQYLYELKEKKFIHDSFKYYLAPDVINEIIKDPKKLTLGGERKKLTVLFSDIRGFTSLSETMTPENLTHLLNEYLTEMTDIIMDKKGLVDKYIGDAVMAFWGAPLANANQAQDACRSAILMIEKLNELNAHWRADNISQPLHIGIGINTGEAVVGNFGSKARFNYTVLGDEVNLASRLEGLNKAYDTQIIITESTKKELEKNPEFNIRHLDTIIVKGKKEPKVIFELLLKPLHENVLTHFLAGKEYYHIGKWAEAIEEFSKSAKDDGPSRIFLHRCEEFLKNPPATWTGVYEFTTK